MFLITYKPEYQRATARINRKEGKYMKKKCQSTEEPVFGASTQFLGLRKVYTKGIKQAHKIMLMSAVAYNLKKYLKFTGKIAEGGLKTIEPNCFNLKGHIALLFNRYKLLVN